MPFPNPHHSGVPGSIPESNVAVDRAVSVCSPRLRDSLFHLWSQGLASALALWEEKLVVSHKNSERAGSAGRLEEAPF